MGKEAELGALRQTNQQRRETVPGYEVAFDEFIYIYNRIADKEYQRRVSKGQDTGQSILKSAATQKVFERTRG